MKSVTGVKQKIPDLFAVIIETDHKIKEVAKNKVISLLDLKSLKELYKYRQDLRTAAEKFVQRQKGGKD